MPPRVIRYSITDRHLHPADERDPTPIANPPASPAPPTAPTPPPEKNCHLDRSDRAAVAQRRDLRSPATDPPAEAPPAPPTPPTTPNSSTAPPAFPEKLCHLDRSDGEAAAQWRDLRSPATEPPPQPQPLTPTHLTQLLHQAHRLHQQNIDYLQLREKDLALADLRTLAAALRRLIPAGTRPRLLLNLGHPDHHAATVALALTLRLDGLHLPGNTPPHLPAEIRAAFARACRSTPILSLSAHTLAEVALARAATADLILFGPVFGKTVFPPTQTDPTSGPTQTGQLVTPALGLDLLAAAVRAAHPIPVLALGGVTPANTPAALAAGAAGIAGIRLFL